MLSLPRAYIDYVPPKLHKGQIWYVSYYVKNPDTGAMKRFRVKVNRFSGQDRLAAAKSLISSIQEKLSLGWNPIVDAVMPRASQPAFHVFDSFMRVKRTEMEGQSISTYASYLRVFKRWLEEQGFTDVTLFCSIDETMARKFMAWLEEEQGISPRSYNNYLSFLITFCDWCVNRGYLRDNFFVKIKRKPKRLMAKKRRLLNPEELSVLWRFLSKNNPEYMAVCLLCYCCLMRPKEIALLRCGDINLTKHIVCVRGEIAKNDRDSFRTIPDAMMPILRRLDLSRPDWFLFGNHPGDPRVFTPAASASSQKRFSDYWAKVVRPACGFGLELQFYSQKDTGITNMLTEGTPINLVQQQADHSSVAMTAIYVGKIPTASEELRKSSILKL